MALINLALLTGNLGKPGAGVNPLRGQNNVQGAAHMGCDPAILTGSVPIDAQAAVRGGLGRAVPRRRAVSPDGDDRRGGGGRAEGLVGDRIRHAAANPKSATTRALSRLEFVIVQDLFLTETARRTATCPARCATFEKDGTFMNSERRIQRVRRAIPPPARRRQTGRSSAPWPRMGLGAQFTYDSGEEGLEGDATGLRGRARDLLSAIGLGRVAMAVSGRVPPGDHGPARGVFGAGPRATFSEVDAPPPDEAPGRPSRSCHHRPGALPVQRGDMKPLGLERLHPDDRLDIASPDAGGSGCRRATSPG